MSEREEMIKQAVEAQAEDGSLWFLDPSIGEAYLQQSLRWLHRVIENGDARSLAAILEQPEDHKQPASSTKALARFEAWKKGGE